MAREFDATVKAFEWESTYGFTSINETPNEQLAATLEALRRKVCCYGGGDFCDCKYGLRAAGPSKYVARPGEDKTDRSNYEQTGCPELRELIHRLLYRPEKL